MQSKLSESGFTGFIDEQINGMNALWHSPGLESEAIEFHSKYTLPFKYSKKCLS